MTFSRTFKPQIGKQTAQAVASGGVCLHVEHADGGCLQAPDGDQKFGTSESHELAQAERDAVGDEALARGEALQEAVHEIAADEWIDAETGGPAKGESQPHLRDE